MSTSKSIDKIVAAVLIVTLLFTALFVNGSALGVEAADTSLGYEDRLFDTARVHTVDIVMDDWDGFIESCTSEEYAACAVVIDGEAYKNVAIRGKGNTSLSSVRSMDSERYSFKLEFDHFEDGKTYHGLDKLSLNNIIQDKTYMKDYLSYRLMAEFGVAAPLCSFVYITVNGEDWGLYLAVEGIEDSFLKRNYGSDAGELYKPDSVSFGGGGPGNGKDFNMEDFFKSDDSKSDPEADASQSGGMPDFSGGGMPDFSGSMPDFSGGMPDFSGGEMPDFSGDGAANETADASGEGRSEGRGERRGGFDFNGMFGGMGSGDVKLQYSDDNIDSYSNIFANAKTDVSTADQKRLIASLKKLSEGEDLESVVDTDKVIRYFVVHNFVCNGDSYTGSIIHNYYLHEANGQLSMIPWDYNLAFGTFQGSDATGTVNDPIDSPMSVSGTGDRPMWDWIAENEEYLALYHEMFAEFLDTVDIQGIIDEAYQLIASYVEKDPTAFYTYEEFETGVAALKSFCALREESVRGQLDGTIPSTDEGQRADDSALVDASALTLSDMGAMGGGGGGGFGGGPGGREGGSPGEAPSGQGSADAPEGSENARPSGERPSGERPSGFPGGMNGGGNMPGFSGGNMPDFSGGNFPGGFSGGTQSSSVSPAGWITLAICAAALLAAIVFAKKYHVVK